ncbi:hypothetical protein ITJ64_10315 [Herbiconiux sp. VKM Ac-1786]|uniref:hypothetical protein n=1 Tax=Herbiconiux sp. VKM Ac-1786 TaxID=2783824 RepID=UPI00188D0924|nr:hypothetical protein [Herbiconiux sp. VKM Ac-1786]MBF4572910.1 hypothetical protein [Herbiconiux sp. VKM Ac-1786]
MRRAWSAVAVGVVALAVGCLMWVGAVFVNLHDGGAGANCASEGPWSPLPLNDVAQGTVTGELTMFPLGRSCTWTDGIGGVATVSGGSWPVTIIIYGLAFGGLALLVVGALRLEDARPTTARAGGVGA